MSAHDVLHEVIADCSPGRVGHPDLEDICAFRLFASSTTNLCDLRGTSLEERSRSPPEGVDVYDGGLTARDKDHIPSR